MYITQWMACYIEFASYSDCYENLFLDVYSDRNDENKGSVKYVNVQNKQEELWLCMPCYSEEMLL